MINVKDLFDHKNVVLIKNSFTCLITKPLNMLDQKTFNIDQGTMDFVRIHLEDTIRKCEQTIFCSTKTKAQEAQLLKTHNNSKDKLDLLKGNPNETIMVKT